MNKKLKQGKMKLKNLATQYFNNLITYFKLKTNNLLPLKVSYKISNKVFKKV